jgi:hypothetical protein
VADLWEQAMNNLLPALMVLIQFMPVDPHGEPPDVCLADLERFPPACVVTPVCQWQVKHNNWLYAKSLYWAGEAGVRPCYPEMYDYWRWRWDRAMSLWDKWDDVQLAQEAHQKGKEESMKYWLRRLRGNLGYQDFYAGRLPCWADLEFFEIH